MDKIAIEGYDTVAYFRESAARKGNPAHTHRWGGQEWHFTSAENRDLFAADPEKYAPQFDGQCSLACAIGRPHPGNPKVWKIVDGKLYFNNNGVAGWMWSKMPGMIAKAEAKQAPKGP